MIDRVYLDMDGVLCDWYTPSMRLVGHNLKINPGLINLVEKWRTDEKVINEIVDGGYPALCKLVEKAGSKFWETLPAFAWTHALVDMVMTSLEAKGFKTNCHILSSPGRFHHAVAGKLAWLDNEFPELRQPPAKLTTVFTHEKFLLATPNALLVDDDPVQCTKFIAAGGNAFMWPSCLKVPAKDMFDYISKLETCIYNW